VARKAGGASFGRGLRGRGIGPIVVAIPDGAEAIASQALAGVPQVKLVTGGATRRQSVRLALEALAAGEPAQVLIHDAARPILPLELIDRLLAALQETPGAIPVLPVVDSLAQTDGPLMGPPARREDLRRVQTPQAFRLTPISLPRIRAWSGTEPNAG
jgi:2-C-methyl-D-erythritol 4-phosphate cytidylyltransferase/2-C-methyl-D-erythritol 2,4-cyclodiphosphate synthase